MSYDDRPYDDRGYDDADYDDRGYRDQPFDIDAEPEPVDEPAPRRTLVRGRQQVDAEELLRRVSDLIAAARIESDPDAYLGLLKDICKFQN